MGSGGIHQRIAKNLRESADWCLSEEPRRERILPEDPDPNYENLYDRFYAIMHDIAVLEHLSFSHALLEDHRYGVAARRWLSSICRCWGGEADEEATASKAYSVSRLLKRSPSGTTLNTSPLPPPTEGRSGGRLRTFVGPISGDTSRHPL